MPRITKQLNGSFHLKWVRKHFYQGSTASPYMGVSSEKCPCQCFGHKFMRSIRFNRSPPGTVNGQADPETSHEGAYQYHQPSDKIQVNPMPDPRETSKSNNSHLPKEQHYAFLLAAKLHLMEPPSTPPPEKPLPEIPTQARPHKISDRIGRKEQDPQPHGLNSPNTTRAAIANYSPFPKLAVIVPPRSSSLQHSSRPYHRAHEPQGLSCANDTVNKHRPRHVAELYQDTSIDREHCINQATTPKNLGD